jgi:streptomycin 6-kinase
MTDLIPGRSTPSETPDGDDQLEAVLQAQIARVDSRVVGGGNLFADDSTEARTAADQVRRLRHTLRLGRFLGPVGYIKSKPQFLLLFDSPGGPVVLKTYGRCRPGEARVQRLWRDHGVRVVDVLDAGDHPTSWLLLAPVEVEPVARKPLTPDELSATTAELAALMAPAHAAGRATLTERPDFRTGLKTLSSAITTHLGGVMVALRRHGYPVRDDWDRLVRQLCESHKPTLLHGDLGGGNVVRDAADGRLWILDSCGYVGPAEFDVARWSARTGQAARSEDALSGWLDVESQLDVFRARALLGLELLMEAGVTELVKDEQQQSLNFPDAVTEELLDTATRLLDGRALRHR